MERQLKKYRANQSHHEQLLSLYCTTELVRDSTHTMETIPAALIYLRTLHTNMKPCKSDNSSIVAIHTRDNDRKSNQCKSNAF